MKQKSEKKTISENAKRILSSVILVPAVICLFVFGNICIIDIFLAIISIIALSEFYKAVGNICNPIKKVGYIIAILTFAIHLIFTVSIEDEEALTIDYAGLLTLVSNGMLILLISIFIIVAIIYLFIKTIKSNMKVNLNDIVYTLFGVIYVVGFTMFLSLIYSTIGGEFLIWYVLLIAWGTDIMAYAIGRRFGKHKFTVISPKKSIEGSIAGIFGGIIFAILYTVVLKEYFNFEISYLYVGIMALVLSIFGQIGDLAASSIKRYVEIKDFGKIIPGHGGILDRLDSIIFMAPVAYILLMMIR